MNKKTLVLLLSALIALCLVFAACEVEHQHRYETTWSYNETEHWHKCTECGEIADKTAHRGGKATCEKQAICEDCGQPYGQIGDHDWGEWTETKAPSCTAKGTETRICKNNAQHTETRDIEETEHEISEDWKNDQDKHWKECAVCHTHIEESAHSFGEWQEVTAATYSTDGSRKRVCDVCGYEQSETIAKLIAVSAITVNDGQTLELEVNGTTNLSIKVLPDNATNKEVDWISSDTDVVEVARGRVLAHAAGTATITVTAKDGQGATAQISVNVVVPEESVSVESVKHVAVNGKITMEANVAPDNATNKKVTWTTDDSKIATIDNNGVLTGVAEGKVNVTATTVNGKTATVTVYVTKTAIDGTEDEVYDSVDKFVTNGESIVTVSHSVLLGDKGLYLFGNVTDAFVGSNSHMEAIFTFGNQVADGKTFQIRLYANGSVRAFKYDSTIVNSNQNWKWAEDKGTLNLLSNIYFATARSENGYALEMFVDYSAFGLTEKPQFVNILPCMWAYKDADKKNGTITTGLYSLGEADLLGTAKALTFDRYGYAAKMTSPSEEIVANAGDIVDGYYKFEVTFKATFNGQQALDGLTFQGDGFDSSWVAEVGNGKYNFNIPTDKQADFANGKKIMLINGKHGECGTFTLVLSNAIPVQSITVSAANTNVTIGNTVELAVTYNPTDADLYNTVTFESDNENVVTVDGNGLVKAVGLGTATITATSANGKTATIKIVVTETPIDGEVNDEFYGNTVVWHNDTLKYGSATATNVVKNATRIYFGEKGLYIIHEVTDSVVGEQSRIEDFICVGDSAIAQSDSQKANMYYFRFYLNKEKGKLFANYYNGKESSTNTFPWTEDKTLELYYVAKLTENGYNVEAYIPYLTLGISEKPQTVNFLSVNMLYPTVGGSVKSSIGNNYGLAQKNFYNVNNFIKFDQAGYYRCNNADFATIENVGDVILGSSEIVDGNYEKTFTVKSKFQFQNSFTAVSGLEFDCVYITEVGNGVYKLSVSEDKQADFANGVTVKILRGAEEIGIFMLKLTKNTPVTSVEISGADGVFVGDDVKFTATVKPDDATDKTVVWDSSDKEIATIDSEGNVTVLKAGVVDIIATADGIQATHTLTIGEKMQGEAVVKVDYTDGKVTNNGTGNVEIDTVTIALDANGKNGTEFVHTDANTFDKGINGDANGALATNNRNGSYLLIKDYALGTDDFTVSTWVYVSSYSVTTGNNSQIFATSAYDKSNSSGKIAMAVRNTSSNGVQITYKIDGDSGNNFSNKNLNLNVLGWHKYTLTRQGTSFKIYLDSTLVFERTLNDNFDFGTQTICFGSYIGETWAYNNGVLVYDNVTVYDYALTQNQIAALTANKN